MQASVQSPTRADRVRLKRLLKLPYEHPFARMTTRRLQNLYLARQEYWRGADTLQSLPIKLTVEATNICNLRCPACFTGAERPGRVRGHMPLELYRRLIDELGDTLMEVEMHNWGEPLLGRHIYEMIELGHARGIATLVCTNFSFPFTTEQAERLVASGLSHLGVSIDGATQETYVKYRRRGQLDRVLENCRLIMDAKRRLGSSSPHVTWSYHAFPHNLEEIDDARRKATELGMGFFVSKAWVVGPDWHYPAIDGKPDKKPKPNPQRCDFLWFQAVVNNDGGVAPCCGVFLPSDDIDVTDVADTRSFRQIWNGDLYRRSRKLFRDRHGDDAAKQLACYDCPRLVNYDEWRVGRDQEGGPKLTEYRHSDGFNVFWNRQPGDGPNLVHLRKKG